MLCTLLISSNDTIVSHFQSVALKFGCVLKVVESVEECYEFAADTPFTAVFLDSNSFENEQIGMISRRFVKTKIYIFATEQIDLEAKGDNVLNVLIGLDKVEEEFQLLFPRFYKRPTEILSGIRSCIIPDFGDLQTGKRLLAVCPSTSYYVDHKIVSAFPVDLLPNNIDIFSDGNTVYALVDSDANTLNRICYNIIIELHNVNISAFAIFTDSIADFESGCQLFFDLNSYAMKLKIEKNNNEVCYYSNEMRINEPFGDMIKNAQATGFKIRISKNEAQTEALVSEFFEMTQISGLPIVNVQFLVCEIFRCIFDDEILYENLFAIISSKNIVELKTLILNACAKEKLGQGDLEVSGNERIIRQICDIIDKEYSSELYLDRVAEQIYLSPAYISRIFKKSTGMNFVKYLNDVRLKKAAALLLEADYPINDISQKVGFSDVSYFCSCFKKKYGMTTIQYRRAYVLKEIEG